MIQKALPAVAYIRMSTDKQEDSPARQRGEIERYAAQQGYSIQHWYEDHGITGTSSRKRKSFQQLMQDAKSRRFQFVLMYEQSRFSREDMLTMAHHLYELREVGVKLVTTLKGVVETDDIGGMFLTLLESYKSREESHTLAKRSTSGKLRKLMETRQPMGQAAIGYDRVISEADGTVIKRVKHTERYQRSRSQSERLEPTRDSKVLKAIQWAFQAISDGTSIGAVATEFNRLELPTKRGKKWNTSSVKFLLRNPIYCGVQRYGRHARGKFARISDSPIVFENAHDPLVTRTLFDAVQETLWNRRGIRSAKVNDRYLLASRIFCGRCGYPMNGAWNPKWNKANYKCSQRNHIVEPGVCQSSVSAEHLEAAVLEAIESRLFSDANLNAAESSIIGAGSEVIPDSLGSRIQELEALIAIGTRRLAGEVLDDQQLAAVAAQWREWKDELAKLKRGQRVEAGPVRSARPVEKLRQIATHWLSADRDVLRDLCLDLLKAVRFHRVSTHGDDNFAVIEFNPDYYAGEPILLKQDDIFGEQHWKIVARVVKQADSSLRACDIARAGAISPKNISKPIQKAIRKGVIRRDGKRFTVVR